MSVGQQHKIDAGGVEAEIVGILLVEIAAALQHATVDKQMPPAAFDHMARAGDAAVGAVKRQLHLPSSTLAPGGSSGSPFISYQFKMSRQMSAALSANQNSSRSSGSIVPSATRNSGSSTRRQ